MPSPRRIGLCLTLLALAGCSVEPPITSTLGVRGAREGVEIPLLLSRENLAVLTALPSASFGTFATSYLSHNVKFTYNTALDGIDAQAVILYGGEQADEALAIIENLGGALEVDVYDLLNRSADREQTLAEYLQALEALMGLAKNQQQALENQRDAAADDRSQKRRASSDIQHDLNAALRNKDYATASQKQEQLTDADRELGDADASLRRLESLTDIYDDLLDIGTERYAAMQLNREALIAGVRVVEVPGAEEIGVLQTGRRSRRTDGNIFDPGGFGQ